MKIFPKMLVGIALLSVIFLGSCKKESKCRDNFDYSDEVEPEQNSYIGALVGFTSAPSTSTCEEYKEAIQEYIDALNKQRECAGEANQEEDLNQDIADLQAEYDVQDCNNIVIPCNYSVELEDELNNVINAATVFANNPTTSNCNAYRDAYQAYLNAAQSYVECANLVGQGAELQQAINEAQADLNAIQC